MKFLIPDGTNNGFAIIGGTTPSIQSVPYVAQPLNGGTLYTGTVRTIIDPSYGYNFDVGVIGDDRISLGGKRFYNVRYTTRSGTLPFKDINTTQLGYLRTLFNETSGYREPFVIELPLTLEIIRVSSTEPGKFGFTLEYFDGYSGSLSLEEFIV